MLSLSGALRVWGSLEPCDMRKGFEGQLALVGERLGEDVRGGALFVFSIRQLESDMKQLQRTMWAATGAVILFKSVALPVLIALAVRWLG